MEHPAAGAFGYDLYDIGVNKLLKGPVGFVAGVGIIAYSASTSPKALESHHRRFDGFRHGQADTITSSMGPWWMGLSIL
ncbi:hypothetical protein IBG34_23110 (plasmid) [Aeromonas media]|nr:hypothetical protein IBG34_23110 [Aeromonas media]